MVSCSCVFMCKNSWCFCFNGGRKNLMWPTHDFLVHLFKYKIFARSSYVIS
ncbi:hypothetical protein O3M35_006996 [Rhynocoris fuscipes]|uniref:Uncharacterized protein n=1 Tax=Rhynocoris fuscipes TaxID=488301 RepID=A0AAW1DFD4_9HEMI